MHLCECTRVCVHVYVSYVCVCLCTEVLSTSSFPICSFCHQNRSTCVLCCTYTIACLMGASATQLSRLQNAATKLCHTSFVPLQYCRHAAAVGLLLKLLDGHCHELLQTFCPDFSTSHLMLHRSSRLATSTQPYLLADIVVYMKSITKIWHNKVPICLQQDGHSFG